MAQELEQVTNMRDTALEVNGMANGAIHTTVDMSTEEGKDLVYTALQDAEKIEDHLNEPIALRDVVTQNMQMVNEQTGEMQDTVRVILIAADGTAYTAISNVIMNSLNTLFSIYGTPDKWDSPKNVVVTERKSRAGRRFFNLGIVSKGKRK